jgi:DNA-binding transcriptional regulator/RsmH inhibitor MraZ
MAKLTKGRVIIPQNVEENLRLAQTVYEKHLQEGDASHLNSIDGYSWKEVGPKIAECLKKHQEAEELKRKMEEAYRERDLAAPEIRAILRASASLLKAVYTKNPKKMGEWGFSVDDTPKAKDKKDDKGA